MSIAAACAGHGFAWYPQACIRHELAAGLLRPLPLGGAEHRSVALYRVLADPDFAGPGVRRLAEILAETCLGAGPSARSSMGGPDTKGENR